MTRGNERLAVVGLVALLVLGCQTGRAWAIEYRLQVASVWEESFLAFLRPRETRDAASGPGLDALEARLDDGDFPSAALLHDRHVVPASPAVAKAWSAVSVQAPVKIGGGRGDPWDEVRWEGKPGDVTVWRIVPSTRRPQAVERLALGSQGALRHFLPYVAPMWARPLVAVRVGLGYVRHLEDRDAVWSQYAGRMLDLVHGIGVIVATPTDPAFADDVYLVVRNGATATRNKVVLGWRLRNFDREAPSGDVIRP